MTRRGAPRERRVNIWVQVAMDYRPRTPGTD